MALAVVWAFYIAAILANVRSITRAHSISRVAGSTICTCTVIWTRHIGTVIWQVRVITGANTSQIVTNPMAFAVAWTFHIATILASVHSTTRAHPSLLITSSTVFTCTVIRARNVRNLTRTSSVVGPAGANTITSIAITMTSARRIPLALF